jgi:hypothetical protein
MKVKYQHYGIYANGSFTGSWKNDERGESMVPESIVLRVRNGWYSRL